MFAQIFLGIAFIIMGTAHICGVLTRLTKLEKKLLKSEDVSSYLRRIGILQCILGVLFICMGIIEKFNFLPVWLFYVVYIFFSGVILLGVCVYNKKYTGHFLLW